MDFTGIQKLEELLLVTVPRDLVDDEVIRLRQNVLKATRSFNSQTVLLDFSQVDICDSFFGRFIYSTSKMVQLMGAKVIISGLQDEVIETMVELGMTLPEIDAVLDLDDALLLTRSMVLHGNHQDENEKETITDETAVIGEQHS